VLVIGKIEFTLSISGFYDEAEVFDKMKKLGVCSIGKCGNAVAFGQGEISPTLRLREFRGHCTLIAYGSCG
jgi:hypothetical protein